MLDIGSPRSVVSCGLKLYAESFACGLTKDFCLLLAAYCLLIFMHRITLIPGDGIGPEVASAVVRIIDASGVRIEWEGHIAGQQAADKCGTTLPQALVEWIHG